MSMYKNIFVNENADDSVSVNVQGANGEIQIFGAGAFSSVTEALAAVEQAHSNAVVKVTSGKYDAYYVVINNGESAAPSKVVSVDFDGGSLTTADGDITVDASGFSTDAQLSIIDDLNANNAVNGTVYVLNDADADATILVGMGEASYVAGSNAAAVYGESADDIFTVINNANNVVTLESSTTAYDENLVISTDTEFEGNVSNSKVTKVVNGATLTIGKDVKYTGANLAAGNDSYFGFGETFDTKGGTIDIAGNVKVNQINADGAGVVNVQAGGVLDSAEICIENGGIADAAKGVMTVDGTVKTASMRVFNGGVVNVNGLVIGDHLDNVSVQKDINIWGGGVMNINANGMVTADESMEVGKDGKLVLNGGSLVVDETLVNTGLIQIAGGTLDAVVSGSGTINVNNGADFTNTKDMSAKLLYVGYDSTTKTDTAASKFTVADGTTVKGGDAIYVREQSSMEVDGKVIAGQYYLKGDTTINAGGEMVFGGVQGVTVKDGATLTIKGDAYADVNDSEPNQIKIDVQSGSALIVDGGKLDTTEAGPYGSNSITIAADADFIITGDSEVRTDSFSGVAKIQGSATLTDSDLAAGTVYIGYSGYSDEQVDLTVKGDTFSSEGLMYVGTDDAKHTLTIEAADAYVGNIYVRAKGEVNISGSEVEFSYISQKGAVNIDGAEVTIREWLIGNSKSADVASVTVTDSVITQINNGGITVGYEAAASFSMTDSTLNMTYSGLTISEGSTFTMIDSALSTTGISNAGALNITVSADFLSDLTGKFTLVNQSNADAATLDSLEINVAGNKYSVGDSWTVNGIVYAIGNGDGNDIVLSASHETIFIDAAYDENTEGYGIYKFSDFESALATAAANKAINRIEIQSDISQSVALPGEIYDISQHLTIGVAAGKKFTVDLSRESGETVNIYQKHDSSSVKIEEGVILKGVNIVANGFATYDNKLTIDGEVYALSLKQWSSYNEILIGKTGKVVLGYGDGQFDMAYGNGSVTVNGVLAEDADLTKLTVADAQFKAGYSGTRGNGNTLNLNNTYFEGGAWFNLNGSNGTINMNNSLLTVSGGDSTGSLSIASSGNKINVKNGSLLNVGKVTVGEGNEINVEDSSLKVSTLTNNGTVAVTGESTLNIGTVTGSSSIDLLDGAVIKDSTVGGTATVLGNVIFRGDNSFNMVTDFGAAYSATSAFWTVEAGSSLTITSYDRYGLGYGDKAAVYGEIEDAREIDRTTLTVEDASLNFHGGLVGMSNWDTKQEFTVQDAYVRFGIEGDKSFGNKSGNYYGTYEYNVDNSVFEAKGFKFYEALSNSTFNATDSQIYVHGVFMTNDADSVFNFTNTTVFSGAQSNGTDDKNQNAGEMNFVKSDITYTAAFTNIGKITTDAASSITAGALVNTGSINSDEANTAEIIGNFTVAGDFSTGNLIITADGVLNAGSITVDSLTMEIGSELYLGNGTTTVKDEFITVTGDMGSAEYTLVFHGWNDSLAGYEIKFDVNGNGAIDSNEIFTVKDSDAVDLDKLSGINFVSQGDKLYVKDFGAAKTSIYICDDLANAADGTTVEVDGVTYTVGVDAFASVEKALASSDVKAEDITEITVGNGDHINDIAEKFVNVNKIIVPAGKEIIDSTASEFNGDLVIDNDGHLEADISAIGKVSLTNTSGNTFIGTLTGEDVDVINTSTGKVEDAILEANKVNGGTLRVDNLGVIEDTEFKAVDGIVEVTGNGTFTNVDVTTDALYLSGLDFTLDADSDVKSVYMADEKAGNLTIDGAKVDQVFGGALDASGEVTFTGNSNLSATTIEDVDKVILSAGSHEFGGADANREYYMNTLEMANAGLTWNWTDSDSLEYNIGIPFNADSGMIKVTNTDAQATLNFSQDGEYSLGDFDVSSFDGIVNVDNAADSVKSTLTLKENTDYFANGATINISADGTLNLDGAGNQGNSDFDVDFNGAGTINVNAVHYLGAEGTINDFTGTINLGSNRIDLEAENTTAAKFTGDTDAKLYAWGADQEYTLDGAFDEFAGMIGTVDGATVTISGENTTDAVLGHRWDYNTGHYIFTADQTFNSDGALDGVLGANDSSITVDTAADLTLKGENSVSAVLKGAGDVIADADQSFTGDVSAFTGTYTANSDAVNGDYVVTFTQDSKLADEMTLNGEGKFVLESQSASVTVNSDASATDLSINNNCITIDSGVFGVVDGIDDSKLIINGLINASDVTVDALVINAGKSLTAEKVTAESTYVYILNPGEQGPAITVSDTTSSFGEISVNSWSSAFTTPFTIVDSQTGQSYTDTVVFILGVGGGTSLTVNGKAELIDEKYVRVYTENGDLLIGNYQASSNVVYVNSDWNTVAGTIYKWVGIDGTVDRIIDVDASKTLERAVELVTADKDGKGIIYVVKGDVYTSPDAMMTADNKVTDMTIKGDAVDPDKPVINLGDVIIEGGLVGREAGITGETSLVLENVSVSGNIIGGASISADGGSADDSSMLVLNGGYYMSAQITGGSQVSSGNYVFGDSELVIKNETGADMLILGRVSGGAFVNGAANVTQEKAAVTIDVSNGNTITVRGDIYAAGSNAAGGTLSVAETKVTFTGDADKLTFTGRVSGGAFGESVGSFAGKSELVFADFDGIFRGLIQDFDTITVSGDSALEFSRKQTLTVDSNFVFDLAGRQNAAEAMFTVNEFGWTYGTEITINAFDGMSGDYVIIDNYTGDYAADFTYKIGSTAATVGTMITVGGNEYTLTVVDDSLVLDYTGNNGIGVVDGAELTFDNKTITAGTDGNALSFDSSDNLTDASVSLTDSTVDGNISTGKKGNVALNTNGDTTIKGNISGSASLVELTVESGKTTIEGSLSTATGDDKIVIASGAELEVASVSTGTSEDLIEVSGSMSVAGDLNTGTDGDMIKVADNGSLASDTISMGTGNDTLVVGKNAALTATVISGGTGVDHLTLEKGAFVTADSVETIETMSIDVDAVLKAGEYTWSTKPLTVTGVAGLTTDFAGAKTIFTNCVANKEINFDGVDAILGKATQIAGSDSVAADDDIWASLTKVDGDLVVAWGRTEVEVGAALDAFNANKGDLTLGQALVAVDDSLLDGYNSTDTLNKKNNGTLA